MPSSKASRVEFPVWVRCTVVLLNTTWLPWLVIASWIGVQIPWPGFVIAGLLAYRALDVMVGIRSERQAADPNMVARLISGLRRPNGRGEPLGSDAVEHRRASA